MYINMYTLTPPSRSLAFIYVLVYNVLLCLVVCLTLLASFFLPSSALINMYMYWPWVRCVALPCFVCLTLLASFFLPSHLSLKHVHESSRLEHTRKRKGKGEKKEP